MNQPNVDLKNDTLTKANGLTQEFKNRVQGAENYIGKVIHNSSEKVDKFADEISDSTSRAVGKGREFVKENPGRSIAFAAATGVVAGALMTLSMRRKRH